MTGLILVVVLVLALASAAWALWRRRPVPVPPEVVKARETAAEATRAADTHLVEQLHRDPVERGNEAIEEARRRRATAHTFWAIDRPGGGSGTLYRCARCGSTFSVGDFRALGTPYVSAQLPSSVPAACAKGNP